MSDSAESDWANLRDYGGATVRNATTDALLRFVDVLRASVYDVGDRLPSIAELTEMVGVSHSNVRAALAQLEAARVVEIRRGRSGGITVIGLGRVPEVLAELYPPLSIPEIHMLVEAWTLMERQILLLASRRATPSNLAALKAKVEILHAVERPSLEFAERTHHFHLLAASIANNRFLRSQYSEILNQMSVLIGRQGFNHEFTRERMDTTLRHYDELFDALASHDERRLVDTVERRHRLQLELLFGPPDAQSELEVRTCEC